MKKMKLKNEENCLNCNREMMPPLKGCGKKFCNRTCMDEYRKKTGYWVKLNRQRHPLVIKKCKLCGESFKPNTLIRRYCSVECRNIYNHRLDKKLKTVRVPLKVWLQYKKGVEKRTQKVIEKLKKDDYELPKIYSYLGK